MRRMPKYVTEEERIMSKVDTKDDCWLWTGATTSGGQGQLRLPGGMRITARRFSFELFKSEIPEGQTVVTTCGEALCVQPNHLGLVEDHFAVKGSRNGNSKLTESDVRAIRERKRAGDTLGVLASEYAVDLSTISNIVTGRTWSHLT